MIHKSPQNFSSFFSPRGSCLVGNVTLIHEKWGLMWFCHKFTFQNDGHVCILVYACSFLMLHSLNLQITDLIRYDSSRSDQTLVYILTLGVVESYRNFGIGMCLLLTAFAYWFIGTCHDILLSPSASALIREVTRYAKTIPTCRAAYLHVISYNTPAMYLYKKMSFTCVRRLYGFYLIHGQHYDAYLFVYYVNGGRSPCSPL